MNIGSIDICKVHVTSECQVLFEWLLSLKNVFDVYLVILNIESLQFWGQNDSI